MALRRYAVVAGLAVALLTGGASSGEAEPKERVLLPLGGFSRTASVAAPAAVGSTFTPLTPVRVLDTRNGTGTGGSTSPIGPRGTITLDLSARVPESATAVVLNVTGTGPTTSTFVTVYPAGGQRPEVSNLNLAAGQTRPNAASVALGTGRRLNIYNHNGGTHVIADLAGYYSADTASRFSTQAPLRVLDTRSSAPVGPGGTITLDLSGRVPATATAVTFNLTGIAGGTSTFVTAWPAGATRPTASNLNLVPGEIAPNLVTVALSADRRVNLFNFMGSTHLVADLAGYYATDHGDSFYPVAPVRLVDTRPDGGLTPDVIGVVKWDRLPPEVLPANATAVVANLTGTTTSASMFVRVWPGNAPEPNASNLNLVAGQTAANLIAVGIAADPQVPEEGRVTYVVNNNGYVDILLDWAGFFAP